MVLRTLFDYAIQFFVSTLHIGIWYCLPAFIMENNSQCRLGSLVLTYICTWFFVICIYYGIRCSYQLFFFTVAYDIFLCLKPFHRRNRAVHIWGYCLSILFKKELINMFLRFCLSINCRVVDPYLMIRLTIDGRLHILYARVHPRITYYR